MGAYIFKNSFQSRQLIEDEIRKHPSGFLEPIISFETLLKFYFYNVYHQRSIKLKASLLSQISDTNLDNYLYTNENLKDFLYSFLLDLELYGNAFLEKAGTNKNFVLHHILGYQGRVNEKKEIFQTIDKKSVILEGFHLKYYSPTNKFYGEPDYLTQLQNIQVTKQADNYNYSFFENGAKPSMLISFENSSPSNEQKEALKHFFSDNFKGPNNAHKTMLLWTGKTSEGESSAKINIQKLDAVEDMSFEKLKNISRDEIIASHGVPPRLVGVVSARHLGGGTELIDQLHSFVQTTLNPKIDLIEDFFYQIGIKHKVKPLDVSNFKDDTQLVTSLIDRQIINIDEAKEILGLNTI